VECKQQGIVCVMVAHGTPCLGPVTQAGCGALCPKYDRGCYGCFGPKETPNTGALSGEWSRLGVKEEDLVRAYRGFNAYADAFRKESEKHER
jgi:coenzyme F420-reducing hydrogenase gamma subunit